ncbi:MAG: GAF domain-containing protein [Nitrospiraceae bacterium]|nr:GAF domain-containing protein [Nitrospiraceae bacterium]
MNLPLILGYPLLIVAGLEIFLGAVLLRQNRRNSRVNKAVAIFSFASAAFSLSTATMYLRYAAGLDHLMYARLSWVGWLSIPAALQFVFYLRSESNRTARIVGWVLYVFWSIVLLASLFTDLIVTDHYQLIPFENSPGPIEKPLRLIGGTLIVWLMVEIVRLRKHLTGIKRAQLNYFFHGTLIFATLGSLSAGFLQVLGGFGFEPGLTAYFSFPWVVLTFYAITRYRLFDIRIVVSNTLTAIVLFSLFAWAHVTVYHMLEPVIDGSVALILSLSLVVLLFFGTPLSSRVKLLVQRTVLQDKYVYQDILRESIKAIVTILDFDELLDYIAGTIKRSLQAENVGLYLKSSDGEYVLRHGMGGVVRTLQGRSLDPAIIELVQQAGHGVVREELERILPDDGFSFLNRNLREIDAELVIPLRYKGQLEGVLTVGQKGSGQHYIQSDIDLLDALAAHAAVAIENAKLYETARHAQESLQESEARLSQMAEQSIRKYLST